MSNRVEMAQYIEAALRGASLRQSVLANNIANMNTPGYRRGTVQFESLLADAMEAGKPMQEGDLNDQVTQPRTTPVDFQDNDVDLEMEVGEMIKNTAMYKTYMRMLGRAYHKMELAIQD